MTDPSAPQAAGAAETSPMGFGDHHGCANPRGIDLGGAATEVGRVDTFTTPPYSSPKHASPLAAQATSAAGTGKLLPSPTQEEGIGT
ncbi:hypothetical protein [Streptomyces sp. NBC_00076]|uniref:hypothetical protein n=1 Tax=Streptomyces sp. NBC_00076 TaxID=2975642 RepID=UPI00324B2FC5